MNSIGFQSPYYKRGECTSVHYNCRKSIFLLHCYTAQCKEELRHCIIAMATLIESKYTQLKRTVSSRITEQSRASGEERYGNWASQQKNYRWDESDYSDRGFRAVYFDRLFKTRAELVCEVLDYCDSDLPNFLEEDNLKAVSFGCGPGCDLLGFQQYYKQKKDKRIAELQKRLRRQEAQTTHDQDKPKQKSSTDDIKAMIRETNNAKVSYTGYDSSSGWSEYITALGYTFREQHIDKRFVDTMPPVDVAILCYFAHSANLHQRSNFWESLKQKCKVILVLDTTYNKEEFNRMLTSLGFSELDVGLKDEGGREIYTTLWTKPKAAKTS